MDISPCIGGVRKPKKETWDKQIQAGFLFCYILVVVGMTSKQNSQAFNISATCDKVEKEN